MSQIILFIWFIMIYYSKTIKWKLVVWKVLQSPNYIHAVQFLYAVLPNIGFACYGYHTNNLLTNRSRLFLRSFPPFLGSKSFCVITYKLLYIIYSSLNTSFRINSRNLLLSKYQICHHNPNYHPWNSKSSLIYFCSSLYCILIGTTLDSSKRKIFLKWDTLYLGE